MRLSLSRKNLSLFLTKNMTFVATGKFIKALNEMSDAVDALFDTEV